MPVSFLKEGADFGYEIGDADIKKWLDEGYLGSAPVKASIRKWFATFRTSHLNYEE